MVVVDASDLEDSKGWVIFNQEIFTDDLRGLRLWSWRLFCMKKNGSMTTVFCSLRRWRSLTARRKQAAEEISDKIEYASHIWGIVPIIIALCWFCKMLAKWINAAMSCPDHEDRSTHSDRYKVTSPCMAYEPNRATSFLLPVILVLSRRCNRS